MTHTDPNSDRSGGVHGDSQVRPAGGGAGGPPPEPRKKRPWWIWLLPLLGLLLLILLLSRCGDNDAEEGATVDPATAPGAAPPEPLPTTPAPVPGPGAPAAVTLPGGGALAADAGVLNTELAGFLAGRDATPRTFTFENLNFATSSADLPADARPTIAGLTQILRAYPTARVRIQGYADARGSGEANQQLGQRRAEAVRAALVAAGIPASRIEAASGGESNPVGSNATAPGQAENRRTELVVLSR